MSSHDEELSELIRRETQYYLNSVDLIAAFNAPSRSVRSHEDWGVAQFRSTEGLIGRKPYAGTRYFDAIESLAARRACELFGAEHCNVQPQSGSQANYAVYKAMLQPGDKILSMSLRSGGHLTHGLAQNVIRDLYKVAHYTVDPETCLLDYDEIARIAEAEKPRLIVAGYSAYPRAVDFSRFRDIGDAFGAHVMADISHIAGFVAAGLHQNPCDYDILVTCSVKKTLRGTRGGFILCRNEHSAAIDRGVFPGCQSSVGLAEFVTLASVLREASSPEFRQYMKRVLEYSQLMASIFKRRGIPLVSDGTDTHMVILNVGTLGLTGKTAERRLESVRILTNRNLLPFDPRPPSECSGLRVGTNTIAARGYVPEEIELIAHLISDALTSPNWTRNLRLKVQSCVEELVSRQREGDTLSDLMKSSIIQKEDDHAQ